jgi:hypothetical protein
VANETVGELFNPWRRFRGVMIPDPIMESDLSLGAKVCYGLLTRFAGENGQCFPTMRTIGRRIGVSDRQARSYVAELVREGYIRRLRGGNRRSNHYAFLWHASFDTADGKDSSGQTGRIFPPEESELREHTDLGCLATHRRTRDAPPEPMIGCLPADWKSLSDLVGGLIENRPTRSRLGRIVAATPGNTAAEAVEAKLIPIGFISPGCGLTRGAGLNPDRRY